MICFECGALRHRANVCLNNPSNENTPQATEEMEKGMKTMDMDTQMEPSSVEDQQKTEVAKPGAKYGAWMMVSKKPRKPSVLSKEKDVSRLKQKKKLKKFL